MKKLFILIPLIFVFILASCGELENSNINLTPSVSDSNETHENSESSNEENSSENSSNTDSSSENSSNTDSGSENESGQKKEEEEIMSIKILVNGYTLTATLEDNSSARALVEKLKEGQISIDMEDYSNFEKVGELGFTLPTNDERITTDFGDIILYLGSRFVIYYDTNTWSFTKLGHVDNITQEELKKILGEGDCQVTISLNN